MSLIVVGSMAFDQIETPFGKSDRVIGGAATYIALAAAQFVHPVRQVSVVGYDYPTSELEALGQLGVEMEGVQVNPVEKSFFWSGKYHMDMNSRDTLVTELNVLGTFDPIIPESYQGSDFLMLGNLSPEVQNKVMDRLRVRPKLVAMDTMNFWMDSMPGELEKVLRRIDVLLVNDAEARQLSGEYSLVKAARKILAGMGPRYVIIKKGEHGALLFHADTVFCAPALPLEDVFDPTGAGDTFAGGFMGYVAKTRDISFENLKTATIVGSAMASYCVEKFGTQRLREIRPEDIHNRIRQLADLVQFDIAIRE